jgi:hypothetical protein
MDPDPTPDTTSFFIFLFLLLAHRPQAHYLQPKKLNFLQKNFVKFFFAGIISIRSTHL